MSDVLAIIPARGGSQELRRKNVLPVDGQPMFLRTAQAARDAGCQVVVSTDDPEIRSTAIVAGFDVHDRGPELADVVVDEVVKAAVKHVDCPACFGIGIDPKTDVLDTSRNRPCKVCDGAEHWSGSVLLVQPTVQPITANILTEFIRNAPNVGCLTIDNMHQLWTNAGWITPRVNRQDRSMGSLVAQELGIRYWSHVELIGEEPPTPTPMPFSVNDLVDIDSAADYRSVTIPKRIALWPIADKTHGMGHLRRCLAIAERLQHHSIVFMMDDMEEASIELVNRRGWMQQISGETIPEYPDLWILDRLSNETMPHLDGNMLSLEDESNYQADITIDALYSDGADWCVLRPEFLAGDYQVRDEPLYAPRLLVMFGGTDPTGLGKIVSSLFPNHPVDWIQAGDDRAVAEAMHNADILITSAGRTVFEAAAVGIPTIVLSQNLRETTHTHLGYEHGNIYLGLGRMVSDKVIVDTVRVLGEDVTLRRELSKRGRPDGLGLDRIVHAIEGLLGGL